MFERRVGKEGRELTPNVSGISDVEGSDGSFGGDVDVSVGSGKQRREKRKGGREGGFGELELETTSLLSCSFR